MSTKQKFEYFWQHRRKQVIIFVIELVVILALVFGVMLKKDVTLTGIALNSSDSITKEELAAIESNLRLHTQLDSEKGRMQNLYMD
jgi:hypothetical protein